MKRFLLKIAYDGSSFFGWQNQPVGSTVQQILEEALSHFAKTKVNLIGSGRTDTGVHALAQYAHFDYPVRMTPLEIQRALFSRIPRAISILEVKEVHAKFHARYLARERTYRYIITRHQTPFNRLYKSHIPRKKIDFARMTPCLPFFSGTHNFRSFAKPNPEEKHYLCTVNRFTIGETGEDIIFEVSANRFLHHMLRRLIGTMITISDKNLPPEIIEDLMAAQAPNQKCIFTVPPEGLYLVSVTYPPGAFQAPLEARAPIDPSDTSVASPSDMSDPSIASLSDPKGPVSVPFLCCTPLRHERRSEGPDELRVKWESQ